MIFSFGTSMTEKKPPFVQSLHKMEGRKFAEKTDNHLDSIDNLHCSGRQNKKIFATVMPFGALTGRLSCGHSETGQTNRRNGNLDGRALTGRSKTALISAVVRSCHSRPAPFRCRFQNARSLRP
jgi:hypothetical protein